MKSVRRDRPEWGTARAARRGVVLAAVILAGAAGAQPPGSADGLRLRLSHELSPIDSRRDTQAAGVGEAVGSAEQGAGETTPPPDDRFRGLTLTFDLGWRHDDNVFRTPDRELSDQIIDVEPGLAVDAAWRKHAFRFTYAGHLGEYVTYGNQSYYDQGLAAAADLELRRSLRAALRAGVDYGHDDRGDPLSRPVQGIEPDKWREHSIGGSLLLGRSTSKAQVNLLGDLRGIRYTNNDQSARDRDIREARVETSWNVSPRWSLLADVGVDEIDYLDPASTFDSNQYDGLIGIAWRAAAKTTGEVRFGRLWKTYVDPGHANFTDGTWDIVVNWEPKPYSKVTGYTSQGVQDTASDPSGNVLLETWGARWRHGFTERTRLDTGVEYTNARFGDGTDDDYYRFTAELTYDLNRSLFLVAGYGATRSESDVMLRDYDDHQVFFQIGTRLNRSLSR